MHEVACDGDDDDDDGIDDAVCEHSIEGILAF